MRLPRPILRLLSKSFNPRTHVGCDDNELYASAYHTQFQSTHPRGVRRSKVYAYRIPHDVSIHAPTWGATSSSLTHSDTSVLFQSTHPRGVRLDTGIPGGRQVLVSIHAPTWGATFFKVFVRLFNAFQSTHPRGVRHSALLKRITRVSFNPRTHVGCDSAPAFHPIRGCLFQSTHPRGVRHWSPSTR